MRGTVLRLAALAFPLLVGSAVREPPVGTAPLTSATGLSLSSLAASPSVVPLYDKLELTFDVENTVATNPQFPYDPAPPPGLPGRVGISVEGLFLPPGETDWQRALRQPGFLYQDYERRQMDGDEWLYPQGRPVWKVRFAPKREGIWHYRVRAQDASVCPQGLSPCPNWIESDTASFAAVPPRPGNHGFVEVSKTDPRYFAFSDGKVFVGLGHNTSFHNRRFTYDADEQFARYAASGVNFVRVWMSGSTIAGSSWGPWVWFGGPGYGGYMPDPGLWNAPPGSGHDFALKLSHEPDRLCLFNGWSHGPIAVKPSTTYRLAVTAQVANVTGPRSASNRDYGLTAKLAAWPSNCPDGLAGYPSLVPHLRNSATWTTLEGAITTGDSQWFLGYLFLTLENTSSGEAHVSQVSLREVLPDGGLGPEILAKSNGDVHLDFNQMRSWDWDYALDQAAQKGVFLKLVVLEKNDRVWNFIDRDGALSSDGGNDNFYAGPNTKVRRLHEYYWRYLAARWGYSVAIHSWELLNEGDPFNGHHYEQANSFARFMHEVEPSRHLVTTSFWHSYPVAEFWGNRAYPDVDYADVHAYTNGLNGDNYEWSPPAGTTLETDTANTYQGSRGAIRVPAGVTSDSKDVWIRGRGDWRIGVRVRAQDLVGSCPYGAPASLAGPQLLISLDSTTLVIPHDPAKPDQHWVCTSPAGTYDYVRVAGLLPVADDNWHLLTLSFRNSFARSGTAWFDDLRIEGPEGREARLYGAGTFDDRERLDHDAALFAEVSARRFGARGTADVGKPVVRGEAGFVEPGRGEWPELARDRYGVWLHNYLWAALGAGGLYELYWYTENIRQNDLYFQYRAVRDFVDDIPLDNGRYEDAKAQASDPDVRVVGQKDVVAGRAYLWVGNRNHTWWSVVNGTGWGRLSGTVTVPGLAPSQRRSVTWWRFDGAGSPTVRRSVATSDALGNLLLSLSALPDTTTDVAIKIGDPDREHLVRLSPIVK